VVRTREFTEIGVPRSYLARMCAEGLLEKVSYGLYRAAKRKAALKLLRRNDAISAGKPARVGMPSATIEESAGPRRGGRKG
jgi:Transcriptional regulator, AbiEi antitoxin